ncbi:hypothetical protein NE237_016996 [Protea cynaroides]|uniref:Small ribosomal subunit protein uS9c n=1 Tax=Protea cynaroides TaxID=273540 RepID=A0A9Q0K775_9MAGN|nr:hypothetical protein NE237_016996 [Protea cynaroides]
MLEHFFRGGYLLHKLNHTHIVLISKSSAPCTVSDYRPISLCNVAYNSFAKVLANRLQPLLPSIISPYQRTETKLEKTTPEVSDNNRSAIGEEGQGKMASISLSSLTASLSSLSFSSQVFQKPRDLCISQPRSFPNSLSLKTPALVVAASAATVASPEDLETTSLEKYVKSRLVGGFAAQTIIGTGRRKCAIARVVLQEGTGRIIINYRDAKEYLQGNPLWLQYVKVPLVILGYENSYDVFVKAHGGGLSGQAQAITLGVARALLKVSEDHRGPLRKEGLLTRDARVVERKKAGLKKARKAPQFSKR